MRRVTSIELLDQGLGTVEDLRGDFDDLWRVNRLFGGVSGSVRLLTRSLERTGLRRVRVLDVGGGDGRMAARLRGTLARQGIDSEFVVSDCLLTHLRVGCPMAPGVRPVVADALALPFAAESFDFVICNLFLHHFSEERALALLASLTTVCRQAVLINDLERHWIPYLFVRLIPFILRHRAARLDGIASVRQAYTNTEMAELVERAGFRDFEIRRMAPFRLGLVLWKQELRPLATLETGCFQETVR